MRFEIDDLKHVVIDVHDGIVAIKATPLNDEEQLVSDLGDTLDKFTASKTTQVEKNVPFTIVLNRIFRIVSAAIKGQKLVTDEGYQEDTWENTSQGYPNWGLRVAPGGQTYQFHQMVYNLHNTELSNHTIKANKSAAQSTGSYEDDILTGVFKAIHDIIDRVDQNKGLVTDSSIKRDNYSNHEDIKVASDDQLVKLYHRLVRFRGDMVRNGISLGEARTELADQIDEVNSILDEIAPTELAPVIAQPIDMHREKPPVEKTNDLLDELIEVPEVAPIDTTDMVMDSLIDSAKPLSPEEKALEAKVDAYEQKLVVTTRSYSGSTALPNWTITRNANRRLFIKAMILLGYAPIPVMIAHNQQINSVKARFDVYHSVIWLPYADALAIDPTFVVLNDVPVTVETNADTNASKEADGLQARVMQYYKVLTNYLLISSEELDEAHRNKRVKDCLEFIETMLNNGYLPVRQNDLNRAITENIPGSQHGVICRDPFHVDIIWIAQRAARQINEYYLSELLLN